MIRKGKIVSERGSERGRRMYQKRDKSEFLKECMSDALLQLMGSKDYYKITADEIVATAGVGRATWFRNFKSKDEAVAFKLRILWTRWRSDCEEATGEKITWDNSEFFFQFFLHYRATYSKLYEAGLRHVIISDFIESMEYLDDNAAFQFYHRQFYGLGLFGLIDGWIQRDFKESIPEMQEYLKQIISKPT